MTEIGAIWFGGVSSEDVGLRMEHHPQRMFPAPKLDRVSIPGRSGELLFPQGAFENYTQSYDVWIEPARRDYASIAQAVASWLYAKSGYQQLRDETDIDTYRLACCIDSAELDNRLLLTGKGTIRFLCKPQRWLVQGDQVQNFAASGATIRSPTQFDALPLITVYGTGAGTLSVGNITCTLNEIDGYITLDSDLQNAYKGTANKNNTVSIPTFPRLAPGNNAIAWTGGVTRVEIIPRWWTI